MDRAFERRAHMAHRLVRAAWWSLSIEQKSTSMMQRTAVRARRSSANVPTLTTGQWRVGVVFSRSSLSAALHIAVLRVYPI
eukprot:1633462-Prymnesium_polylepis.2